MSEKEKREREKTRETERKEEKERKKRKRKRKYRKRGGRERENSNYRFDHKVGGILINSARYVIEADGSHDSHCGWIDVHETRLVCQQQLSCLHVQHPPLLMQRPHADYLLSFLQQRLPTEID